MGIVVGNLICHLVLNFRTVIEYCEECNHVIGLNSGAEGHRGEMVAIEVQREGCGGLLVRGNGRIGELQAVLVYHDSDLGVVA